MKLPFFQIQRMGSPRTVVLRSNGREAPVVGMMRKFTTRNQVYGLTACFVVGISCWFTFVFFVSGINSSEPLIVEQELDTSIPQPDLSPADVVTMQVHSIRSAVFDPKKLGVCYSLASPENRLQTGPFSRFSELVMQPPFDRLANCVDWQLGGTVLDKDFAAVFVSVVSKDGVASGFRFILRQQELEGRRCWLTEGVQVLAEESLDLWRDYENDMERKIE